MHIVHEHPLHLYGERRLIDECIYLEIVFEAPEVHIGRSDAGKRIVDYHQFGMEESRLIEIYLHTSLHHLVNERVCRHIGAAGIRAFG